MGMLFYVVREEQRALLFQYYLSDVKEIVYILCFPGHIIKCLQFLKYFKKVFHTDLGYFIFSFHFLAFFEIFSEQGFRNFLF